LQAMAEKELRLEPFSADEEMFLKSIAVLQDVGGACGGPPYHDGWDGWYTSLFPWDDDNPALIADIHTNGNVDPPLAPPAVLHVATGPVASLLLIADTDEGPVMYVGPAFTYYEVVEEGFPPVRLTDEAWQARFQQETRPLPPDWTSSFRLSTTQSGGYLFPRLP
jgi:hypothetical protein